LSRFVQNVRADPAVGSICPSGFAMSDPASMPQPAGIVRSGCSRCARIDGRAEKCHGSSQPQPRGNIAMSKDRIFLDWTRLLGFNQADPARLSAKVGEKDVATSLQAKVGDKSGGGIIGRPQELGIAKN
jgi:hypothetical protein